MDTYITVRQHPKIYELTFEDVLMDTVPVSAFTEKTNTTGTITRKFKEIPDYIMRRINLEKMVEWLECFNSRHQDLFDAERESLYRHYKIPKKTGGWRPIDEPNPELQAALEELAWFLQERCGTLYHTSAFAYVKDRCIVDAVRKHADFKSEWFLKTDVSGFFPNTTLEFTMRMLSMVFPLSEIMKSSNGKAQLEKAISLGFLNGGLPQGTKLSPCLTNIIMIPIDHALFNELSDRKMVYTRYADDMHISAIEKFPYKNIVNLIENTFKLFGAPYVIKPEKTHFGSVKGQNWMLGLMLNGQHNITVGYRNKKYFKAMICNFVLDTKNGNYWNIDDVRYLQGLLSYYRMIEKDYFNAIINKANNKWNTNIERTMKQYLNVA